MFNIFPEKVSIDLRYLLFPIRIMLLMQMALLSLWQ